MYLRVTLNKKTPLSQRQGTYPGDNALAKHCTVKTKTNSYPTTNSDLTTVYTNEAYFFTYYTDRLIYFKLCAC